MDDELNNVQEQSPYLSLFLGVIVEAHNNHWRFKDTNVRLYELYHTCVFD